MWGGQGEMEERGEMRNRRRGVREKRGGRGKGEEGERRRGRE